MSAGNPGGWWQSNADTLIAVAALGTAVATWLSGRASAAAQAVQAVSSALTPMSVRNRELEHQLRRCRAHINALQAQLHDLGAEPVDPPPLED